MYTLGILYTLYVCVCSAHRQVLLDLRRASRPLCKGSAILNCIQHSRMRSSRWSLCYYSQLLMGQDHHAIAYDQPDCLLLITHMMALSSATRLNNSLLQTSSDQVMFKTFLQSHISQLSSLRTSSFFKVHDSAPYRRVLQMTVFIIVFFRQRL